MSVLKENKHLIYGKTSFYQIVRYKCKGFNITVRAGPLKKEKEEQKEKVKKNIMGLREHKSP